MRSASKNNSFGGSSNRRAQNTPANEPQNFTNRRDSLPISSVAAIHKRKRQSCPTINYTKLTKNLQQVYQQNQAERLSTNQIYDSRKRQENDARLDWKILTLKEIKNVKKQIVKEQVGREREGANRKIFVSISKNNKGGADKQKYLSGSPKLAEIGGRQALLRSISNKRNIVNNIEFQLDQTQLDHRLFCA